jgi:hypothetical protein
VRRNKILRPGLSPIIARVYKGESRRDAKERIALDYLETSLVAHSIRDEVREISPGVYLGNVCWGWQRLIDSAL